MSPRSSTAESPPTPPSTPPTESNSPNVYAIYFPDDHPSLFVSFLGAGREGAALLVRSLVDGNLYVRKRKRRELAHETNNEANNTLPHAHIPKLIGQTTLINLPHSVSSLCLEAEVEDHGVANKNSSRSTNRSTIDLWGFANGLDVGHLVTNSTATGALPAILVFQLMYTLLSTTIFLHSKDIAHGDLLPDNIFVHWDDLQHTKGNLSMSDRIKSNLPKFLLGDFGASYSLPPTSSAQEIHNVSDTSQAVYRDLLAITKTIAFVINGGGFGPCGLSPRGRARYADTCPSLLRAFDTLAGLPSVLRRFGVARMSDGKMFDRTVGSFIKDLERMIDEELRNAGISNLFAATKHSSQSLLTQLQHLRPTLNDSDRKIWTLTKRSTLLGAKLRLPGPWCVAKVDAETGELRGVELGKRFCEDEAMVTRLSDGSEVGHREVWAPGSGLPHG